ncbi:MAG: universal stress protein [Moraxellaceae bacterium]
MLPIKTLVVVLQPGKEQQPVWSQARAWAQVLGARLEVLLPVPPDVKEGLQLAEGLADMAARNAESQGGRWLETLLAAAPAGTGHTVVATTTWAETVLHEARRLEADLLCVGQCESGPDLKPLLRQLPCPLLLARREKAPRRFAAALGAGAADAPHKLLNQAVLEHLIALTLKFQGEARVLSALPNPVELVPLMGDAYAASYVSTDLEAGYRENLTQQVTAFGLAEAVLRISAGRPDLVLPDLVKTENVDCLLLGTVARKGFSAFWLGNTAEDVLPRVDCDVLLLRPQDYFDPN